MPIIATVENDTVRLPDGVHLPNGTRVRLETMALSDEGRVFALPSKPQRPLGLAAGDFEVPEDFDHPLPTEILDSFEGR